MANIRDELQDKFSKQFIQSGFFGICHICPRFGKIKLTLNCITPNDRVLVGYPEVNIKKSWISDMKLWNFNAKNVKFTTYRSFKKVNQAYDVLVLDEIHTLSQNQMIDIANYIKNFNIKKVIGLSGTISKETEFQLMDILKLPIKIVYSIDEAIKDGVITDYRIQVRYVPLSTAKNIEVKWSGGNFMTSEKASFDRLSNKLLDFNSPSTTKMLRLRRMDLIKRSKAKISLTKHVLAELQDKRVLVFTGLTEVADSLDIDSYHSKSPDESVKDDFISGKTDKLAIVNKLNTGITFSKLNTAIINFFDSNAENMAQKISRITCMEYDNPDKIANVVIICSTEEVERKWLNKALSFFDPSKIQHLNNI